ncbi:MAG TPA: transcriptional regulator NanR [Frateuria sp.]|uniref:transcriptional regulator NanR n=1 Tax=Frateuria sp. TaxID=2211372 RepID=UPI002D8028E7|nr:transcriptional regulator NanR [Frateuria sp.]HET6806154.1 transcriptional regulator NanR [Frateuria sp.]
MAIPPIRRRKLYEEVADAIEQMIRDGQLAPGDQLPSERELRETFGVGRSAVREAMLSLQRMGLVAVNSGERSRVLAPSAKALVGELSGAARRLLAQPGGVARFQQARALFEIGLARLAAQVATAADVARLATALRANRESLGDLQRFRDTDVAFHFAIAEIPHNPIFTSLHEAVVAWLTEQRTRSGRLPGAGEAAYAAHARIYEAIAARDPSAAELAMQEHLDAVAALYWKAQGEPETMDIPAP